MRRSTAAGLGLALLMGSASGDEARAQIEQRIRLAAKMISDSSMARRIAASGNLQAMGQLEASRVHHSMAEDALQRGDLATARREVDNALREVGQASRMVPDSASRQALARQRYEQVLASLERLVEAWHAQIGAADAQDGDLVAALGLIGTARAFGAGGRFVDAVATLETAERHVLTGMNRALHKREIDYTQRATTPEKEFQLELQRHQAMADLLPLAMSELKPRGDAASLIERYAEASRGLRAKSQQLFQAGDVGAALASLRNAMLYLQKALQAAGVSTPQPTGSPP